MKNRSAAYEKQADKLVKQLKKYQKDYEYVTFESNIHGDLRKNGCGKKSGNGCRRRYFITFFIFFVYGNVI